MSDVVIIDPRVNLQVHNSADCFPIRRIYCVGRNYAAHAREMGADPSREQPFFFCKPQDAVVPAQWPDEEVLIQYPPQTQDLHYEVELVIAIGQAGRDISATCAWDHVWGYTVGLDMTRRDLQRAAKDKGHPWELAKAFDQSAPVGLLVPLKGQGSLLKGRILLELEGQVKQLADISDMIWSVPEIIHHLSCYFELKPGDLIFTGTPEGVGSVQPGQSLRASVEGAPALNVCITN